ncbi:imidazole glycerol phosphate synthase subunit HisH [Luteirhabdus pelagi]|uniref:imidazole glycerol phosphate synthase subunit HisH n=1 Tax=Luteirhabdus pelagi TaxID=2792783 RepID=UPI00193ABDA9|nr:imidazole glycerol phosphate synthase subunit HisH [Luteirhabdus pelagi]
MKEEIVIIDYGAGNVKSLEFAFNRLGKEVVVTNNPAIIKNAEKVIFPGVGHAGSAMQKLKEASLQTLIPNLKQPVLGICLGMQLLCSKTAEDDVKGLGVFDVEVKRFTPEVKVPQMGWNTVSNLKSPLFKKIEENSYMYLVHSYYAPICKQTIASSEYGGVYSTALQNENFYGVQFHPEKSGKVGAQLVQNFIDL